MSSTIGGSSQDKHFYRTLMSNILGSYYFLPAPAVLGAPAIALVLVARALSDLVKGL